MRCNNCGWDNAPGSSTCVKCGHPLQMDSAGYGNNNPYHAAVAGRGGSISLDKIHGEDRG